MKKENMLVHWRKLRKNQKICPRPVSYRHTGSTYEEDGIRITGSRAFVDAVLSRLKPLLACENKTTRLQVSYQRSTDRASRKTLKGFNCYVQVHQRGQTKPRTTKRKKGVGKRSK